MVSTGITHTHTHTHTQMVFIYLVAFLKSY